MADARPEPVSISPRRPLRRHAGGRVTTLNLRLIGDPDDESFARVSRVLRVRFGGSIEHVDISLAQAPHGWVIARATATIPNLEGPTPFEGTSWAVLEEVRGALEEAREPLAGSLSLASSTDRDLPREGLHRGG